MNARKPRIILCATALAALAAAGASGQVARADAPDARPIVPSHLLEEVDSALQAGLETILARGPYRRLVESDRLSVALVDLTDPAHVGFAGVHADRMRYAASLPKIGILLGVFAEVTAGRLEYTPELRGELEAMIRHSSNATSSALVRRIGFEAIEAAVRDPALQLYHEPTGGGIWVGKGYGGLGVWKRDPVAGTSHGATARQVARFLVLMEEGELLSPWASQEMKSIMGDPAIHHKFVAGLGARPGSRVYRKSGTWRAYHADAALVERDGHTYVAVALMEGSDGGQVLSSLIVDLDDLVHGTEADDSGR